MEGHGLGVTVRSCILSETTQILHQTVWALSGLHVPTPLCPVQTPFYPEPLTPPSPLT